MTVTSTTAISGPYNGNGSTTQFDYTFYIADESELKVTLADSDGAETVQTLTTHYSVSIGGDGTGTFTMVTAPATGETVVATLNVPLTQATDLLNYGTFSAETHEDALDKLTRIVQQQQEEIDRCVKVGVTTGSDPADVVMANYTLLSTFVLRAPILLAEETASADATIDLVDSAMPDYNVLLLEIEEFRPASDGVYLEVQVSTDGGSSWVAAASYAAGGFGNTTAGDTLEWSDSALDAGRLVVNSGKVQGSGATEVLFGRVHISGHVASARGKWTGVTQWTEPSASAVCCATVFGECSNTSAYDGIRLKYNTGNITSGTARLWGMPTGS